MRNLNKNLTMLLVAFSLMAFAVNAGTAPNFTVGKTVAAKWSDDNYYLAKIKAVTDGKYEIDYEDGSQGTVSEEEMKEIPAKPVLNVGDKVLAVWSGGKFYSGTVEEVKAKGAIVKWDDGSEPSMVEFGKIIKE